ncbi:MAG: aquaporin [Chthoniobacterales bacterium]
MSPVAGDFLGTTLLILPGHGVARKAMTTAWAFAVFVAVFTVAGVSVAHINPASVPGRF